MFREKYLRQENEKFLRHKNFSHKNLVDVKTAHVYICFDNCHQPGLITTPPPPLHL